MMEAGIMPTESLLVRFSAKRAWKRVTADQLSVIEGFKAVVTHADWTQTDTFFATGTVSFPLGVPTVDGVVITPKRTVGCGTPTITIGTLSFQFYDPGKEIPLSGSPCAFVQMGTTPTFTMQNLTDAITNSTTGFIATFAQVGITL